MIQEIAQRLTWRQDLLCKRDEFNRSKELVNLENGVFNLETGELLEHDPRFRFLPTRSEPATWKTLNTSTALLLRRSAVLLSMVTPKSGNCFWR